MYLIKYIFVNIVCHSYRMLFIAVSIKNIVDMSGTVTNNSLKHVHVCHSLHVTAVRKHIASALWRAYRQLRRRHSCLRRSALSYEGRKISAPSCAKFSTTTPSFCTFS